MPEARKSTQLPSQAIEHAGADTERAVLREQIPPMPGNVLLRPRHRRERNQEIDPACRIGADCSVERARDKARMHLRHRRRLGQWLRGARRPHHAVGAIRNKHQTGARVVGELGNLTAAPRSSHFMVRIAASLGDTREARGRLAAPYHWRRAL